MAVYWETSKNYSGYTGMFSMKVQMRCFPLYTVFV